MLNAVSFPYFGRQRNLKFDDNAIADFEREMKVSFFAILNQERFGFDAMRVLLWAGLKHEDQSLTPIKIGNWMGKYRQDNKVNIASMLEEFTNKILEAIKASGILDDLSDPDEKLNELEGNAIAGEEN